MTAVAAVVPTCRNFTVPEQTIDVQWYVVHDEQRRHVEGDAEHIIAPTPSMYGRKCDSIRSAGFLQAYRDGATHILTVDDDCIIPPDWAESHVAELSRYYHPWSVTCESAVEGITRGMPIALPVPVAITHGLWDGVPDLSAAAQLAHPPYLVRNSGNWQRIHPPFAQSAMNLGFRREVIECMYQPFQGPDTPFDRYADIWGGMFAQRVLCKRYAFSNGGAVVYHKRASDANVNLEKEAPGVMAHDNLWRKLWNAEDRKVGNYRWLAGWVADFGEAPYWKQLGDNMLRWSEEVNR